jgi:hypothetical protein
MNGLSPPTAPDDHSQLAAVAPQVRECPDRILRRAITPNRLLTMDSRSRRDAVAIPCTHNEEHCGTNQERR